MTLHCTYCRGTGEALRITSTTAWYGHESPPFVVSLLSDPTEMTDVRMHILHQELESIYFEETDILSSSNEDTGGTISSITSLSELTLHNSFTVHAERMEMDLSAVDLLLALMKNPNALLSLEMAIPAKNVVMVNGTIKVPYSTENMLVSFDESRIDIADMKLTTINALKMVIGDPLEMILGMVGRRVVIEDVDMSGEWMYAKNVSLDGVRLAPSGGEYVGTFEIQMNNVTTATQNISCIGYSEIEGKYYMIVEGRGVAGDLTITIPGDEKKMVIKAENQTVDEVEFWTFVII